MLITQQPGWQTDEYMWRTYKSLFLLHCPHLALLDLQKSYT